MLPVLLHRAAASLVASLAIYAAVELVDLANVANAPPLLAYPLRLPHAAVLVMPLALLVAGSWAGAHLARTGQLVGLAAVGLDLRRTLLWVPATGLAGGAALWLVADHAAPAALAAWSAGREQVQSTARWVASDRVLYRVGATAPDGFVDVLAITLDRDGLPVERVEARRATREGETWVLLDAVEWGLGHQGSRRRDRMRAPAPIPAPLEQVPPELLSGPQLAQEGRRARAAGASGTHLAAELWLRVGLALACPFSIALGLVAGAAFGRRPAVAAASVAVAGLVSWLAMAAAWMLAASGEVPSEAIAIAPLVALGLPAACGWASLGTLALGAPPRLVYPRPGKRS